MGDIATPNRDPYVARQHVEEDDPFDKRTPFQHDRDRIIHSTALKRLQYKTQVYMIHEGDLYRTRLTHTLEVAQISRSLAIHLGANVDLAEAIALAHDLGHTPFGHAGEKKLKDLLHEYHIPFNHNVQGYRIVTALEERYPDFKGLNLTHATLEGMLRHNTLFDKEKDIQDAIPKTIREEVDTYWKVSQPGPEAQIVNMADIIAYASHDIEDALSVGLIDWDTFKKELEDKEIRFLSELIARLEETMAAYRQRHQDASDAAVSKVEYRYLSRQIIGKLIVDVCAQTKTNIKEWGIEKGEPWENIKQCNRPVIALAEGLEPQVNALVEDILMDCVYHDHRVMLMLEKARRMLALLFGTFMSEPRALPKITQNHLPNAKELINRIVQGTADESDKEMLATVVADYISGMTDKYAMDLYQLLVEAYEKAL